MQILTITGIECAINECTRSDPQPGICISPAARALADIYGLMIYKKALEMDFTSFVKNGVFGEKHVAAVERFYNVANQQGKEVK